jgi:hypothetical protein
MKHFCPFCLFLRALSLGRLRKPLISLKKFGRGDTIRTCGLYVPNAPQVALYLLQRIVYMF